MSSSSWTDEQKTFLTGDNALYVSQLYASYLKDPASVSSEWQQYFGSLKDSELAILKDLLGPTWGTRLFSPEKKALPPSVGGDMQKALLDSIGATELIHAYRAFGHRLASLDPLGLQKQVLPSTLNPQTYKFREEDYDRPIFLDGALGFVSATLRDLLAKLRQIYCGTIGFEFLHIQDLTRRLWLQNRIEESGGTLGLHNPYQGVQWKKQILKELARAEDFEVFLHKKYPAAKRFGLDGAESFIPGLLEALNVSSKLGVKEVVIGMAHRGRLNVLTNIMGKSVQAIFSEFQDQGFNPKQALGSGDVKYHLGASTDRDFEGGKMHLSLTANPSHLEAVDPVVVGKVRAKEDQQKDQARSHVMGLLLHGDAAFPGQGIVAETLTLSQLPGYQTGGTFHIIINNQIGFTTSVSYARSSTYCSDLALSIQAPVFHVNADDSEAVVNVMHLAAEYRHTFKSDVVIDLVCYRRFGHNEGDEPSFTQPLMYKAIKEQPTICQIYAQKLIEEGIVTEEEVFSLHQTIEDALQDSFHKSSSYKPSKVDWLEGKWAGLSAKTGKEKLIPTGVNKKTLVTIGKALSQVPPHFNLHATLKRGLDSRHQMVADDHPIDWSMGEALAFGSLLLEGHPVRLSGQDTSRGTFSQRHAILRDQGSEEAYLPLNHLSQTQAPFEAWDSPLSEAAVLGFEVGYSLAEPNALVLWEAQFGDFSNGAQVIIDQFIACSETKWQRLSGLVMLLPHGYEGQGPEHSSARLERYLQLCAEDNMQVVNCTTPANFFHVLRRQIHLPYRKPLIAITPKSLLRHKLATSSLKEFEEGTYFREVIPDSLTKATRVILCSGKVYYDLLEKREKDKIKDIALIRLEQLYPFPYEALLKVLSSYKKSELIWCQEEPQNMGAWTFLEKHLEVILKEIDFKEKRPRYIGRPESASTAVGLLSRHTFEQNLFLSQALSLNSTS